MKDLTLLNMKRDYSLLDSNVRNLRFSKNRPPDKMSMEDWVKFVIHKLYCLAPKPPDIRRMCNGFDVGSFWRHELTETLQRNIEITEPDVDISFEKRLEE
jgi:hypothetical protein